MGILIDSTLLIHAERRGLAPPGLVEDLLGRFGDVELAMSAMTAGELLHGCCRAETPERRARREEFVESMFSAIPVVALTLPIMRVFAETDAKLRADGIRLPTSDLLIASTAIFRGDEVATGNIRHFRSVPGLVLQEVA